MSALAVRSTLSPSASRPPAVSSARRSGLDAPHRDVAAALAHHGFVQLDPINVCGRMHDLILRNRVAGYREHDLLRHVYGAALDGAPPLTPSDGRAAFEHYFPAGGTLAAFPLDAWPYLTASMEERSRWRTEDTRAGSRRRTNGWRNGSWRRSRTAGRSAPTTSPTMGGR